MRKPLALAAVICLGLPATTWAAPAVQFFGRTVKPLLYFNSAVSSDYSAHWTKRQVYIFRDGTVLNAALGEAYSADLPLGAFVSSGTAAPDRMKALGAALSAARVSQQTDCFYDPPDAPFDWYFGLTWFGTGERKNTFLVGQTPGPRCSREVEALIDAIEAVITSASRKASTRLSLP